MTPLEKLADSMEGLTMTEILARGDFKRGFRRSKRGNLWREWDGLKLCVFKRDSGKYDWSVADEDGPRYSDFGWDTEQDAMNALYRTLEMI